jgi:thiol:disulfide interchange protein DsbD
MPMIARSSNDAAPTRFGLCVAATLALSTAAALPAQALQPAQHARVALITDHAAVAPGQSIHAGLRIAHDEGWHTYWVNSGDSGLATRFDWTMPAGATAGDIEWPAPERLPFGDLVNLGYKGDLVLPARLMVPADARPGARFEATLRARWLICADVCIPDEATLTLSLPVATAARPSEDAPRIAAALAQVPVEEPGWQGRTRRTAAGVEVEVHGCAAALGDAGRLEVYPKTAQVVANTRIDARHDGDGVLRFTHPASEFFAGMPETVEWVLVRHDGDVRRAFAVRLAGEDAMARRRLPWRLPPGRWRIRRSRRRPDWPWPCCSRSPVA